MTMSRRADRLKGIARDTRMQNPANVELSRKALAGTLPAVPALRVKRTGTGNSGPPVQTPGSGRWRPGGVILEGPRRHDKGRGALVSSSVRWMDLPGRHEREGSAVQSDAGVWSLSTIARLSPQTARRQRGSAWRCDAPGRA